MYTFKHKVSGREIQFTDKNLISLMVREGFEEVKEVKGKKSKDPADNPDK